MIGIEITNVVGVFMAEYPAPLTTVQFRNIIDDFDKTINLEVTNAGLDIVYLPKELLLMSVYKNIIV